MKRVLIVSLILVSIILLSGIDSCVLLNADENAATHGLQIVLKDLGFPELKYLQPTIKEIQLKNEGGTWITIWSSPEGKAVKLTPDGAEIVLETVSVPAGTYTETKLKVSSIDVEADINRDGDTEDKNVEVILTLEEFNSLPQKEKPQAPGAPQQPQAPEAPQKPEAPTGSQEQPQAPEQPQEQQQSLDNSQVITGAATEEPQEQPQAPEQPQEQPQEPEQPQAPEKPQEPSKPEEPQAPQTPYTIEGGLVHMGEFLDEKHTATPPYWDGVEEHTGEYLFPIFENKFVYGGSGGKIIYDFILHPLKQKRDQISVEVTTA